MMRLCQVTRWGWVSVLWASATPWACGPGGSVQVDGQALEMRSAAAYAFQYPLQTSGLRSATVLVFGEAEELCATFEDLRNYCNHRNIPDVRLDPWGFARPVGAPGVIGWVLLRDATVGPATNLPLVSAFDDFGVTLSDEAAAVAHSESFTANIHALVPGERVAISFQSTLEDDRRVEGRVDAPWCPALAMVMDDRAYALSQYDSGDFSIVEEGAVVGQGGRRGCAGEARSYDCRFHAANRRASCTCEGAGPASCEQPLAEGGSPFVPCCNLRFGDDG